MDIKEEITMALFDNSVKYKVSQMLQSDFEYKGHKDRMPIGLYNMRFRLFKPTLNYINFEFLETGPMGSFFHPVGVFDNNLNIYVINEFAENYKHLKFSKQITLEGKFLDL